MENAAAAEGEGTPDFYETTYSSSGSDVYREVRTEAYGEDIGQTGWMTPEEQDEFLSWLDLMEDARLLDVACGSGRASLRIVRTTSWRVHGVDLNAEAVETARSLAAAEGLSERSSFQRLDATQQLPFDAGSFDAIVCIDAVPHLPDRERLLRDWSRVLKPGGRILYTDPVVITGPVTDEEIALRSSIGPYVFVPAGENERSVREAGLELLRSEERTEEVEAVAEKWSAAREARAEKLRRIEGPDTFEAQQRFNEVAGRLARERRLSRFAYLGTVPPR